MTRDAGVGWLEHQVCLMLESSPRWWWVIWNSSKALARGRLNCRHAISVIGNGLFNLVYAHAEEDCPPPKVCL